MMVMFQNVLQKKVVDMVEPKKPVLDTEFWRRRLVEAHATGRGLHSAVFNTDPENWNRLQNDTAGYLQRHLKRGMKVLDAGCAYGPLYDIIQESVRYIGIDISPDFIEIAKFRHPDIDFRVGDICNLPEFQGKYFDLVICRSVKNMIQDNEGDTLWEKMQAELLRVGRHLLLIGYDADGSEYRYI